MTSTAGNPERMTFAGLQGHFRSVKQFSDQRRRMLHTPRCVLWVGAGLEATRHSIQGPVIENCSGPTLVGLNDQRLCLLKVFKTGNGNFQIAGSPVTKRPRIPHVGWQWHEHIWVDMQEQK